MLREIDFQAGLGAGDFAFYDDALLLDKENFFYPLCREIMARYGDGLRDVYKRQVQEVVYPLVRGKYQVEVHPRKVYEDKIMRRFGEEKVEVKVGLSALLRTGKRLFRRCNDTQYPCEVRGGGAHGALRGDRGIEDAARLHQFKDGGILKLYRVSVLGDGARMTHKAPLAGDGLNEAEKLHHARCV